MAVFVKYSSPPSSGTKLDEIEKKLYMLFSIYSSRLVPKLGGLGYFVKYPSPPNSGTKLDEFQKRLYVGSFQFIYPDLYPSLVDSGTSQSTRAHQARVPI